MEEARLTGEWRSSKAMERYTQSNVCQTLPNSVMELWGDIRSPIAGAFSEYLDAATGVYSGV